MRCVAVNEQCEYGDSKQVLCKFSHLWAAADTALMLTARRIAQADTATSLLRQFLSAVRRAEHCSLLFSCRSQSWVTAVAKSAYLPSGILSQQRYTMQPAGGRHSCTSKPLLQLRLAQQPLCRSSSSSRSSSSRLNRSRVYSSSSSSSSSSSRFQLDAEAVAGQLQRMVNGVEAYRWLRGYSSDTEVMTRQEALMALFRCRSCYCT
jgi:hypothetical protein